MMRRTALTLGSGLLPMLVACALMREERRALGNASRWHHGVSSVPDSVRLYMAANRWATDMIEDALLGRRRAPDWFDTVFAVYWLSDSGRRKYLRTLRRFARHADRDVATFAIYGLARHAGDPAVRARLLEVDATAPIEVRYNMVASLALVNDSSARSLLRAISRRDLRPDAIRIIERALSSPPLPAGKGRWPCMPAAPVPWTGQCPR
jgi:hypothetical protein